MLEIRCTIHPRRGDHIHEECGEPSIVRVRRICVHEHVRVVEMCAFHKDHHQYLICLDCLLGKSPHWCRADFQPIVWHMAAFRKKEAAHG